MNIQFKALKNKEITKWIKVLLKIVHSNIVVLLSIGKFRSLNSEKSSKFKRALFEPSVYHHFIFRLTLVAFRTVRLSSVRSFETRIIVLLLYCTQGATAWSENPPSRRSMILPHSNNVCCLNFAICRRWVTVMSHITLTRKK